MFFCKYAHHRKKGWLHTFPLHHKQDFAGFSFGGLISVSINWISTAGNILLHNTLLNRYPGGTSRLQNLLWHGLGCPDILRDDSYDRFADFVIAMKRYVSCWLPKCLTSVIFSWHICLKVEFCSFQLCSVNYFISRIQKPSFNYFMTSFCQI